MFLLNALPDPQALSHDALMAFAQTQLADLHKTTITQAMIAGCVPCELQTVPDHICGTEASADWRKFFFATLLADWACYEAPADRADYARLKYIMTSAYRYFRVWLMPMPDGRLMPIGYTGWYPIAKFVFDGLRDNPSQIDDRGLFMPMRFTDSKDIRYAYAFNISIIPQLKNTSASRRLLHAYLKDKKALGDIGFAAITVGADGSKLSQLSNFASGGTVTVQGAQETLFLKQPD